MSIPLTEDRWHRLEALYLAAAALAPDARDGFIERETAGDPALCRDLQGMLAHGADGGAVIARAIGAAALETAHASPWIGRRIGAYRICREIARGGMGLVFEAVRDDDEYRKTVALKIASPWQDPAPLAERIRLERQILANLEHPHIARFLDGGTEDGTPYFVMELVRGSPITTYCETHHLDLPRRVALFRQVCAAVHFAHESLVVHRDLKPSNIFVTDEGVPKLLDFGIAKLLDPVSGPDVTSTGTTAWTPDYASPEQVRGRPVTTRTDVYSLGLILYELITGQRAQAADSTTPVALDRSICETEPARPSERVAGRADARRLRGDLDTIVMTAIRKEPERRYGTAAALSDDLGRYLEGRPILARPSTPWYRGRKFLTRHRFAATAGALVLASAAAGVVSTVYEARRAERRFQQVRVLANTFVFDVHDRIESLPGATAARKAIVQTALTYLESLRQDAADDPSLTRELAAAYLKIGTVQGVPQRPNLGDTAGAVVSFSHAEALLVPLAARGDREARRMLVSVLVATAVVQDAQGNAADMFATLGRAKQIGEALLLEQPADPKLLASLGELYGTTARLAANRENHRAAEEAAQRAVDLSRRLLDLSPGNREYQDHMGAAYNALGQALHGDLRLDEALDNFRSSVRIRDQLVTEDPQNSDYRHNLLIGYGNLGDVLGFQAGRNLGDGPGAAAAYEKAIALGEWAREKDPQDRRALVDLVNARLRLATIETDSLHDQTAALEQLALGDRIIQRLMTEDPKSNTYRVLSNAINVKTGETLAAAGRLDPAAGRLEAARAMAASMAEGPTRHNQLIVASLRLAEVKARLGRPDAVQLADVCARELAGRPLAPFNDALLRSDLGHLYARMAARGWPPGRDALSAKGIASLEESLARWRAIRLPPAIEARRRQEIAAAEAELAALRPHPARERP